jgi:gliding motility-associated-like protein
LVLHAPPGFAKYLWQDGTTDTVYYAAQQGAYILKALNANGCYSKDTVTVLQVYPAPVVNLGKGGMLCANNTLLHAGTGQQSYLWQNGSTDSVFNVTVAGTYWVKVTGNNGCLAYDTVVVTGFYPAPSGFLLPTAALCANGAVQLTVFGQWAGYLWGNGAATPYITSTQPGQYWVQVSDFNGCAATDTATVTVKTDCPQVLFFPNAFTPNGDSRNDVFRPYAGAPLEKYSLLVYNRWGQKIFESHNASAGWDGTFNHSPLPPGTFVYICNYQFFRQPEAEQKGTVVLMR